MLRRLSCILLGVSALACTAAAVPVTSASVPAASGLRVGAAKVDITPALADLPAPFKSVADPIYLRAVVIDSGGQRAVMIIGDVPTISAPVAADLIALIAREAKVAPQNIILGTTHTHNAVRVDPITTGIILPGSPKFVAQFTDAVSKAVKQAVSQLQPARVGSGWGEARLAGNRNVWSHEHNRYIASVDRTGTEPIDHRVGVVKFEALDGKPIAYLLNYAVVPVISMAMKDEISGDIAGATARILEERSGGAPALFTIGATGEPLYRAEGEDQAAIRNHAVSLMQTYGSILAEEALAVSRDMKMSGSPVKIAGQSKPLICPGKRTTPFNLPDRCAYTAGSNLPACNFQTVDADPVKLELGVVRIGDIAFVQTDSNVAPAVGEKLHARTPLKNTWIVTLTFGPVRFVVDDAAYAHNTYEATATSAKMGCAESGYLTGALEMIDTLR